MANAFLCQSFAQLLFQTLNTIPVSLNRAFTQAQKTRELLSDTTYPDGYISRPASRSSQTTTGFAISKHAVGQAPTTNPSKPDNHQCLHSAVEV